MDDAPVGFAAGTMPPPSTPGFARQTARSGHVPRFVTGKAEWREAFHARAACRSLWGRRDDVLIDDRRVP